MIVPLGQVQALLNRSFRTAGFHGKQRGDFHAVFHSMNCFFPLQLGNPTFFLFLHPPLSLLLSPHLSLEPKSVTPAPLFGFEMSLGCADCCV